MYTLFDDPENRGEGLIKTQSKQLLSKKQKDFFKYMASIESLKEKLASTEKKLIDLEAICCKEIDPENINVAKAELEVAKAIGNSIRLHNFTNVQVNKTKAVIIDLCEQAFDAFEPLEEDINFYNKWAPQNYDEFKKQQLEQSKRLISSLLQDELGIDLDMNQFNDDLESFARFHKILDEKMHEKEDKKSTRKKTKKQIVAEAKKKAAEELKGKSLRSVYVSLAKLLHPDLEENESLRAEKEELMKTVTSAYESKDLPTLLKLEMKWVYKEAENIEKLSDEKLDIFIDMLKDQIKELKEEVEMLKHHPKFERVAYFIDMSISFALGEIMHSKAEKSKSSDLLNSLAKMCPEPIAKKRIVQFVNDYYDNMPQEDDDEFFDEHQEEFQTEMDKIFNDLFKKRK